jgi:hypothetical protein
MSVLRFRGDTAWLSGKDGLKKRRQQFERYAVNCVNEGEEITRIQNLTVGELLGLKPKKMSLSVYYNHVMYLLQKLIKIGACMIKNRRGFVLKNSKPIWLIFKCRYRHLHFVNPVGSDPS